jgi:hypothetical protein
MEGEYNSQALLDLNGLNEKRFFVDDEVIANP